MTHGGFQQRFRRRFAVLFLQILFQRTGVNTNADRNIFVARTVHHRPDTLFATDVAGVNAQAIDPVFRHFQRDAVVKMDIRHQRHIHLLFNQTKCFGGIHGRHRDAHDVHANPFQRLDLPDRGIDIRGAGIGHRLHGNRRAITDRHLADVNPG